MTFSHGKGTNNFTNIISAHLRFYSYLWEDICIKTIFERRRFISYWIFMSCLCSVVVLIHGIGATRRIVSNNTGYIHFARLGLQKEFYKKDSNWNIVTQTRKRIDLEQMDAFERFWSCQAYFFGKGVSWI